ncbi:restriction endonuclease subunit R [Paenibacillus sp. PK3_47]|uniref:DEAD/DEAH box helicase family protein n=1 Tax=Paenibacillus sp. PK3_47 TaxID=2072642 RepID=UPI00201D9725|nr:DEAD/DEAH box helicase family protein [Paenibacillus sp. PK3_47]UQZ32580.1 restriction endonuclease subunit R [Paenibacillus sp. PK3_47]
MENHAKTFPGPIKFCYPWRSYQKRILDQLEEHLRNRHLHLVAPPGSGKTVLGLEIMLRINRPAIILAPTLTIKEQWANRFTELFLGKDERPDWLSTSIHHPAMITITTYQALHAVLGDSGEKLEQFREQQFSASGGERIVAAADDTEDVPAEYDYTPKPAFQEDTDAAEKETAADPPLAANEIIGKLKKLGIHTVIFDEAHHLRVSWWRSALQLCDMLGQPTKIALTATPPYDVSPNEWQRYIELCGPINEEISVPELVRHGELCPHQDYIMLTPPEKNESARIRNFRLQAAGLRDELIRDVFLTGLIAGHPWITNAESHMDEILSSPEYYSSMVIYLRAADQPEWRRAVMLLGLKEKDTPDLTYEWLEELLNGILFKDNHVDSDRPELKELHRRLSQLGMIERRKLYLRSTPALNKMLVQSVSKLKQIGHILDFERSVLGNGLRMVILADYIRKEDMPKHPGDEQPLQRLGVVPIFESIRRGLSEKEKEPGGQELPVGVLTGSLVILPAKAAEWIRETAGQQGITLTDRILPHDSRYMSIEVRDSNRSAMVGWVTALFNQGSVRVLVGTAALLGEGWDAPGINSMIMASYVSSFMLSNQMRGRAIRSQRGNPDKTGAIWHLACVDTELTDGGEDMASLDRRFRSLVGLSITNKTIESGMDRIGLAQRQLSDSTIELYNAGTLERARDRHLLKDQWASAISLQSSMAEELKTVRERIPKPLVYPYTIKAVLIFACTLALQIFYESVTSPQVLNSEAPGWLKLGLAALFAAICASPWIIKAAKMMIKHQTLDRSILETGLTVYTVLYEMKLVRSAPSLHLIGAQEERGTVVCWLKAGSTHEKTLFLNALQQLLDPVENPRYLIYRTSRRWFGRTHDYHAVPEEIGRRKEHAERFAALWKKNIGPAELVYTRTPEGHKKLLNARVKSLASMFIRKSERISAWR